MTAEIILNNMGFAFWYIFEDVFLSLSALLLIYCVVLGFYTLIIKR